MPTLCRQAPTPLQLLQSMMSPPCQDHSSHELDESSYTDLATAMEIADRVHRVIATCQAAEPTRSAHGNARQAG
ncbi:hypothetical protein CKO27_17955 [Thiocystis violacea]|nr:hypothetical protein [Thiocystis violacea]